MATVMLRHTRLSFNNISKVLQQSQIRLVKYSSDSSDESAAEAGRKKITALLASLKSSQTDRKHAAKEPKLAKPKPGSLPSRDKTGKLTSEDKNININVLGMESEEIVKATKSVSSLAKDSESRSRVESVLLKKLKHISAEVASARNNNEVNEDKTSMSDLFSDLKVEKKPVSRVMVDRQQRKEQEKNLTLEQIAFLEKRKRMRRQQSEYSIEDQYVAKDLFSSPPLGVFTQAVEPSKDTESLLKTWRSCSKRELTLLSTPAPRNALEEFIEWTEQGKLWTFPINNEQGIDCSSEPFHTHVFLEHLLEPWCPPVGPVRHFMELVCTGLSKNPYVSVDFKLKTITWFKDFFEREDVNDILVHQGAWVDTKMEKLTDKSVQ